MHAAKHSRQSFRALPVLLAVLLCLCGCKATATLTHTRSPVLLSPVTTIAGQSTRRTRIHCPYAMDPGQTKVSKAWMVAFSQGDNKGKGNYDVKVQSKESDALLLDGRALVYTQGRADRFIRNAYLEAESTAIQALFVFGEVMTVGLGGEVCIVLPDGSATAGGQKGFR